MVSKEKIFNILLEQIKKLTGDRFALKVQTAYNSALELVDLKVLIPSILIATVSWFFECIGFYIVICAYSTDISLSLATFIYSFSTIAGAISMLPGGLGLTEGSMTGLLVLNKVPKDESAAITIIIRLATLWFAVALGLITLYIFQRRMEKIKR